MEGTVLTRSEDYWFGCHTTVLIQVVPGTSVLIPDIMDHITGTIEPVLFISILMPVISKYIPRSYHKNASDHPLLPSLLYTLK